MNHEDTATPEKREEERDPTATMRVSKPATAEPAPAAQEEKSAEPTPEPLGWAAQFRQMMQRSAQGEARTNIKRQQFRDDRTKAFLMLAGSTVVLGLMFFALFSSPSSNHKNTSTRPNEPHLGRGPAADADTSRSVTPLLNADTRSQDEDAGKVKSHRLKGGGSRNGL